MAPGQILINWSFLLLGVPSRASLCVLLQLQGAVVSNRLEGFGKAQRQQGYCYLWFHNSGFTADFG